MPDVAQLGIQITADDRASKTLQDVEGRLRLTESAVDGLSATTVVKGGLIAGAMLAVGTAALKMAEQGVHAAADLQHAVASISTIKPDVDTSAVFKSLNTLQTQVPQTAKQLGDSLYDVFSSIDNVTQEQGLKLVETFAKGATAAQTDAKTFGTAIAGVLNAYKLDTSEATKVSDVFFNTVNRGVVTGPQLAAGLGPAIAAAKALGVSYEEAFALIVGATKEGGDAAQNINNITNLFSKLPTKEATTDLNALGIATQDVAGNLRKPIDVLTDLKAKLDTMGEAARATTLLTIFPDLQARQGAQVIMSQLDTVKTALAENRTETNSTAEAYRKMAATAVEQGKLLSNTWTALLTDLSVVALPGLVAALGLVGAGVRDLRETFETASTAVGEASTTIQTKTTAIKGDLDTLTTYADTNLRPQWDAFWKAATGGNYRMPVLPEAPPAPSPTQQAGAAALGPTSPLESGAYIQGLTPAPPEQTRSPFGGPGAGYLSPEEAGLGALGNIRGQLQDWQQDMRESNARTGTAAADTLAENFAGELNRRRPMMHAAGVELGDATAEGITAAVAAAAPAARSAALIEQDLADARKRTQDAALGGAVAIREHTEALAREHEQALGGAVAIRDHADALDRERTANLGGALSIRDHADALTREHEAALGGAVAIRSHEEALAREHEQALGGAVAIRAHDEALAQEKEQALGGALAIRAHEEALAQQKEQALGGVVAIRAHEEALARDKEANLGGALAIREHSEQLQREHDAALGGVAAIRDHEDALQREKTAALGGEVGLRAHAEALNEEKIAALGGRAAILDHQAALQKLDAQAQQSRTVFVDLADKMANYAKSTNEAAVAQSVGYTNANQAADAALKELTGTQQAEVKALQNAGDAYGALTTALAQAGVGYQDIAGLINGEREATERLNESLQRNTQYRAAQRTAIQQANETQFRSAITATGQGGGLPQYMPAGQGTGTGFNASPFANPAFASWYAANYGERETFINEHAGSNQAEAMATVRPMEVILEQFRTRFMDSFEAVTDHERTKITEALSHAGETFAQRETRTTGVPTVQTNVDNTAQGLARQALTAIEATMTIQQAAALEYTAQLQGAAAALSTQGRRINTTVTAEEALAEATDGLTGATRVQHTTKADITAAETEAARQVRQLTVGTGAATRAISSMPGNIESWAMSIDDLTKAQQDYWGALKSAAQALRTNTTVIAGQVIGQGQTYGQIYGNTGSNSGGGAGGSNQGISNVNPGNYYGIPVVSPITGGTLRGYADGGWVNEPVMGRGLRSGAPYAFGEHGPEYVSPGGGTTTVQVVVQVNGADALRDPRLYEQMLDRGLTQALQKRRLVVTR